VDLPTAVLVNEGTASTAELTAIALQEVAGASVVGMPTFGKGLIHELRGVPEGDGVQLVSTGRLRSIDGRDILAQGVRPDHPVMLAPPPLLGLGVKPASEGDLQFQEAVTALKLPAAK
jgi:carboxyl-terminal processing protease